MRAYEELAGKSSIKPFVEISILTEFSKKFSDLFYFSKWTERSLNNIFLPNVASVWLVCICKYACIVVSAIYFGNSRILKIGPQVVEERTKREKK